MTEQKWIPTSERLPTWEDADENSKVWAVLGGRVVLEDYDFVFDSIYWMPKPKATPPEPPR